MTQSAFAHLSLLEVSAPKLEYSLLAPLIIVLLGAVVGVLLEAVLPRHHRRDAQAVLAGLALLGALVSVIYNWYRGYTAIAALGSVALDGPTWFIWAGLLVFGAMALVLFAERHISGGNSQFAPMATAVPGSTMERDAEQAKVEHTEVFPLLVFAVFGMMLFAASNDLLTMFVALEIFSFPLYLLSGLSRRRRLLSQEAALKYFLLGALSSAMFLYGSALLYGYSGSFRFSEIDRAVSVGAGSNSLLLAGLALVGIGLLFKVGAVPFHSWTPDVYTGAPTPVTGFMAIATKFAAIGALLRVYYVALGAERWDWQPMIAGVALLTMAVGAIVGVVQTDIKRMLAYSSIAHAGFLLVAVVGTQTAANGLAVGQVGSVGAILFYMASYGFATLGAFALLMLVRKRGGETTALSSWVGLGRRHPVLGALMTLFMLSFAGIPLTGGFVGKLLVFVSAWRGGFAWLVAAAIVFSMVAAFFYIRLVVVMFFREPEDDEVEVAAPSMLTWAVIGLAALATVAIGVYPAPLMDLARGASVFLR